MEADKKLFSVADDGHSFDQVLFYGHESMLVIFEVLLFGVIDLMAESYVLSAVVLYVIMEVCFRKHRVVFDFSHQLKAIDLKQIIILNIYSKKDFLKYISSVPF